MLKSTIGKKIVVAVTGLIMFGFVVGHLIGNLQVFQGAERLNAYAEFLKTEKPLLWGARLGLLVAILLHIVFTVQLSRHNRASRPIPYRKQKTLQATLASQFMLWSGIFLLTYIVYHILHLTIGATYQPFSETDVYANVINGFSQKHVVAVYVLGMIALGFHLNHGIGSLFQTLGLTHPKYNTARRVFSIGASVAIAAGYISIPVAVLMGIVR